MCEQPGTACLLHPSEVVERVFTFGYGHIDPRNGVSLADKCAVIKAKSAADCRKLMIECFGRMWAFEYESIEAAAGTVPDWQPQVYIVIDWQAPKADAADGRPVPVDEPLWHIWEHRLDGRLVSTMQRRCDRCDRWETDDNRDGECVKPKIRVTR
jgi:hypothetical protein